MDGHDISEDEARRRQAIVDGLIAIGIEEGVFHVMARDGQLLELKCETPKCYCEQGRDFLFTTSIRNDHFVRPAALSGERAEDPW